MPNHVRDQLSFNETTEGYPYDKLAHAGLETSISTVKPIDVGALFTGSLLMTLYLSLIFLAARLIRIRDPPVLPSWIAGWPISWGSRETDF